MAAREGDTKTDLTRLDQLPEMEHHDDPDIDQLFTEQAAAESTGKFSVLEEEAPPEVQAEEALAAATDLTPDTPAAAPEAPAAEDPFAFQETPAEAEEFTAMAAEDEETSPATEAAEEKEASEENEEELTTSWAAPEQTADSPAQTWPSTESSAEEDLSLDPLLDGAPPPVAEELPPEDAPEENHPAENPPPDPREAMPPETAGSTPEPPPAQDPPAEEPRPSTPDFPPLTPEKVNVAWPSTAAATPASSSLHDFADTVFPANASSVAPAYSLKLEDIDPAHHDAIMAIIREAKIYAPADEALLAQSLASGRLLIAHISEYMAVTLAHQLRRLTGKLVWGLAQDVHPSPSYSAEENRGNALNSLPGQNQAQTYDALHVARDLNSIILTTAPQIAGHQIKRYLDLITEQAFLRPAQLGPQASDLLKYPEDAKIDVSEEIASWDIYRDLTTRLRQKALAAQADAIINLNFVLHPVFLDTGERGHHLTATGNLVTLAKSS